MHFISAGVLRGAAAKLATVTIVSAGIIGWHGSASARDLPPPRPAMLDAVRGAAAHACNAQTAAALDAVGFEPAQIAGVTYYVNSTSADVGRAVGVDAYVKVKDQSGSVVVQHRGGCSVGGAYATGSIRLPRRL
jgi:hypothetical protein